MSYKTEELLRKGQIAALRDDLHQIEIKCKRLLDELKMLAFPLDGVASVDTEAIVQTSKELAASQGSLKRIKDQIEELGG